MRSRLRSATRSRRRSSRSRRDRPAERQLGRPHAGRARARRRRGRLPRTGDASCARPRRGRRRDHDRHVPPRPRGRSPALRVRGRRGAAPLRAAARRLRCRAKGRARDRVGLDACGASPCDRAGRHRPIRGDPGDRAQDGAACRARAQGLVGDEEAVEDGDTHVVARDALVELGYSLVDAEAILSKIDPALAPEERVRQALRQAA